MDADLLPLRGRDRQLVGLVLEAAERHLGHRLPDEVVTATAKSVAGTLVSEAPSGDGRQPGALTHIGDLLAEPDDAAEWIVDGMLPAGGMSVLGGKPKGGKSTTARAIALRVSRGDPVLGRQTTRGPVVYLGLEDPRRTVRKHFRTLGATAADDLYVFTGHRPAEALAWLAGILQDVDPTLIVVDTLQHLLGVSDLNDYARVVEALGPLLGLIRRCRAHMMLVHHAGKGERSGFDAILGSTAIVGTVDVALLLRRRDDGLRTLATLQRVGEDLPESVLRLSECSEPIIEGTRQDYDKKLVRERVLAWATAQGEPVTRDAIKEGAGGRAELVVAAVRELVEAGELLRTGTGKRGDPYLYSVSVLRSHIVSGTAERNPESVDSWCSDAKFSVSAGEGSQRLMSDPRERNPAALDDAPTRAEREGLRAGW